MSTMTPLVEYLAAVRSPKGASLVRQGGLQVIVPIFPPASEIAFSLTFSGYASIAYYHRFSPSMVPGAFTYRSQHSGIELQTGTIGTIHLSEGNNYWLVVTKADPITTTISNISGVDQFFETGDSFLIIDSKEDYEEVMNLIRRWGRFHEGGR